MSKCAVCDDMGCDKCAPVQETENCVACANLAVGVCSACFKTLEREAKQKNEKIARLAAVKRELATPTSSPVPQPPTQKSRGDFPEAPVLPPVKMDEPNGGVSDVCTTLIQSATSSSYLPETTPKPKDPILDAIKIRARL